jgi:hypothetical protein
MILSKYYLLFIIKKYKYISFDKLVLAVIYINIVLNK